MHAPYSAITKIAWIIGSISATAGAYNEFIAEAAPNELSMLLMLAGLVILAFGFLLRMIEVDSFQTKRK